MRETLLLSNNKCDTCEEEIIEGSYAFVDEFENKVVCQACQQNDEEYFGEGYTAKMD